MSQISLAYADRLKDYGVEVTPIYEQFYGRLKDPSESTHSQNQLVLIRRFMAVTIYKTPVWTNWLKAVDLFLLFYAEQYVK